MNTRTMTIAARFTVTGNDIDPAELARLAREAIARELDEGTTTDGIVIEEVAIVRAEATSI